MKRLLLCRHAKSGWNDIGQEDIDRPLDRQGKKEASLMGKRLAKRGVYPDMIVSSPAKRALATAGKLAEKLRYPTDRIIVVDEIYSAFAEHLLAIVRKLDNSCKTVYLVGHNPEITLAANLLGNLNIDNMPTCGIVAIEFDIDSWQKISTGNGLPFFFDFPHKDERQ